jgi:hypothetical protein
MCIGLESFKEANLKTYVIRELGKNLKYYNKNKNI